MTEQELPRFRQPHWIGLRFGAYLFAIESTLLVLPMMIVMRQSGLLLVLASSALLYVGSSTALAWLWGRVPWIRRRPPVLLLALLASFAVVTAAVRESVGQVLFFGVLAYLMAWIGSALSGKPTKLRLALRILVIVIFGGAYLPLLLPAHGQDEVPLPPPPDTPNVALIVLDTVRRDHLSTYGYPRQTSPHLTELAQQGLRFDDARVNAMWTLPSHATFFTGTHPSVHGANSEHWHLDDDHKTVASALRERGYETVCITANPLISRKLGTAAGFTRVHDSWRANWIPETLILTRLIRPLWDRDSDKGGAASVRYLRRWLDRDRDRDRPFLLFINVMEAHAPYSDIPPEFLSRFLPPGTSAHEARQLCSAVFLHETFSSPLDLDPREEDIVRAVYDAGVAYDDEILGQLVGELDAAGVLDDTMLLVAADHGELLGEHQMWGHVHSLYDELLRVPLIIRPPGGLAQAAVVSEPVQGIDVAPTIGHVAGLGADTFPGATGRDIWSDAMDRDIRSDAMGRDIRSDAMDDATDHATDDATDNATGAARQRASRPLIAEHFHPAMLPQAAPTTLAGDLDELFVRRRCVIADGIKYMVSSGGDERLFDLTADPGELVDVQPSRPEDLALGRALLAGWIAAEDTPWPDDIAVGAGPDVDEATRARLRELGYIE